MITGDSKRAYVSNSGNNTITEIDLADLKILRTLNAGPAPEHLVFSNDKKSLFVTNPRAGKVSEISISSGKVTQEWEIGDNVHGLDIGDDGKTLLITAKKGDLLAALDTKTSEIKTIKLVPAPYHLNTINGTGKIYVSIRKESTLWVIDQQSLKILNEIKLPAGEGHQMAVISGS